MNYARRKIDPAERYDDAGVPCVCLYAGCPGSGKSKLCRIHASADILETGRPCYILDPERTWNWERIHHAPKPGDVKEWLFGQGVSIAYTHPPNQPEQIESSVIEATAGGNITLVADEARYYSSAHYLSPALTHAARAYRHHKLRLRANSQRLADLHQDLVGCATVIYVFRLISPADIERAYRLWGIPAEITQSLGAEEYIEVRVGF